MKFMTVVIGVFLLFSSSFILRDLLSEDDASSNTNVVQYEKEIDHADSEHLEVEHTVVSSEKKSDVLNTDEKAAVHSYSSAEAVEGQSEEELAYKRMLIHEQREVRTAEQNSYRIARKEWRAALNSARKEAVSSGDYTKYEALKAEEPTKNK